MVHFLETKRKYPIQSQNTGKNEGNTQDYFNHDRNLTDKNFT